MLHTTDLNELKKDIVFDAMLRGRKMRFHSTWGLFNPTDIDEGSRLLIEEIEVKPTDAILDLGCGYGAIGIALAPEVPQGVVHMVDKDFVAVEYTRKNAAINHPGNSKVYLSNGFSHVPAGEKFDVIVSNLPAKVGKELLYIIIKEAKQHLKPDGTLYVVTISGLKEYIKRQFKDVFGNYKKVKQAKTYVVSMAKNS